MTPTATMFHVSSPTSKRNKIMETLLLRFVMTLHRMYHIPLNDITIRTHRINFLNTRCDPWRIPNVYYVIQAQLVFQTLHSATSARSHNSTMKVLLGWPLRYRIQELKVSLQNKCKTKCKRLILLLQNEYGGPRILRTPFICFLTSHTLGQRRSPKLKDKGCDSVLTDQGCRTREQVVQ
jgi:hypothetical protein